MTLVSCDVSRHSINAAEYVQFGSSSSSCCCCCCCCCRWAIPCLNWYLQGVLPHCRDALLSPRYRFAVSGINLDSCAADQLDAFEWIKIAGGLGVECSVVLLSGSSGKTGQQTVRLW